MIKQITSLILVCLTMVSCTENNRAKMYGGNIKLELPENTKLVNITWKDGNLWYLTKSMNSNDSAETYKFQEESSFGIAEGLVTIIEKKK